MWMVLEIPIGSRHSRFRKLMLDESVVKLPAESLRKRGDDGSIALGIVVQLEKRSCNQFVVFRNGEQSYWKVGTVNLRDIIHTQYQFHYHNDKNKKLYLDPTARNLRVLIKIIPLKRTIGRNQFRQKIAQNKATFIKWYELQFTLVSLNSWIVKRASSTSYFVYHTQNTFERKI